MEELIKLVAKECDCEEQAILKRLKEGYWEMDNTDPTGTLKCLYEYIIEEVPKSIGTSCFHEKIVEVEDMLEDLKYLRQVYKEEFKCH